MPSTCDEELKKGKKTPSASFLVCFFIPSYTPQSHSSELLSSCFTNTLRFPGRTSVIPLDTGKEPPVSRAAAPP